MLNTSAQSTVVSHIGPVYRKKRGNQLAGPKDFHGWAVTTGGIRYAVFRSRRDREIWITAPEFRSEYEALKRESFDKFFTTRKGFIPAIPEPGVSAWYQGAKRRFLKMFNENLQPVPFRESRV